MPAVAGTKEGAHMVSAAPIGDIPFATGAIYVPAIKKKLLLPNYIVILQSMGATKTDLFTKKQNEIAAMAKAIGHPARIAILQHLAKINACICGDLVDELGLAQATISQHLKELKNVGLIQGTIEGTSVCYCINPKVWQQYRGLFTEFFKEIPANGKCC